MRVLYLRYLPQLEQEYAFWMQNSSLLTSENPQNERVVLMPDGNVLNRYYDNLTTPRAESYAEDIVTASGNNRPDSLDYLNLRAACESGWDFSSRWLANKNDLGSIETTNIIAVDLNCLLHHLEKTLTKAYAIAKKNDQASEYENLALKREQAINKYCYDNASGFYADYHFIKKTTTSPSYASGMFPLFENISTPHQTTTCIRYFKKHFIKKGGVVTSLVKTSQQWDAPNGWAPLQYICVKALLNNHQNALAEKIMARWIKTNQRVYNRTGKMLEKYNVCRPKIASGGGEYPTQDGFGWTNAVYMNFANYLKNKQ